LKPRQYAKLMSECAFMLGIGNPILSPSPIIGLANGVAVLIHVDGNITSILRW